MGTQLHPLFLAALTACGAAPADLPAPLPPAPSASADASASAVPSAAPARAAAAVDAFGEPLPAGATARLGSLRHRVLGGEVATFVDGDGHVVRWRLQRGEVQRIGVDQARFQTIPAPGIHPSSWLAVAPDESFFVYSRAGSAVVRSRDGELRTTIAAPTGKQTLRRETSWILSQDGSRIAGLREGQVDVHAIDGTTVASWKLPPRKKKGGLRQLHDLVGDTLVVTWREVGLAVRESRLEVWDVPSQRMTHHLEPKGRGFGVGLSSSDRIVVVEGNEVRLVDRKGGAIRTISLASNAQGFGRGGFALGFSSLDPLLSPQGDLAAVPYQNELRVIDLAEGAEVGASPRGTPLAFSQDGTHLALEVDRRVYALPIDSIDQPPEPTGEDGHERFASRLVFAPDGGTLATFGDDAMLLWRLADGGALGRRVVRRGGYDGILFGDPDVVAWGADALLYGRWGESPRFRTIDDAAKTSDVALAPAGDFAVVLSRASSLSSQTALRRLDLPSGRERWTVELPRPKRRTMGTRWAVALTSEGEVLVGSSTVARTFDAETGEARREKILAYDNYTTEVRDIVVHGQRVVFVGESLGVVDGTTFELERKVLPTAFADPLAVAPDLSLAAFAIDDRVELWSLDGQPRGRFAGHFEEAVRGAFSPDGARLATASKSGPILVWDLSQAAPLSPAEPTLELPATASFAVPVTSDCGITRAGTIQCDDLEPGASKLKDVEQLAAKVVALPKWGCAIVGARRAVQCWGASERGETGVKAKRVASPRSLGILGATSLAVHYDGGCAVDGQGDLRCWGQGLDDKSATVAPRILDRGVAEVAMSGGVGCIRRTDGTVACWGRGSEVLGTAYGELVASPQPVAGIADAAQVALSGDSACARLADGTVRCWGRGYGGKLGDGRAVTSSRPVTVEGLSGVTDLVLDRGLGCALTDADELWCWGHGGPLTGAAYLARPARVATGIQAIGHGSELCIQRRGETTWRCR